MDTAKPLNPVDTLLNLAPFTQPSEDTDVLFIDAMKASIEYCAEMEPLFDRWLKARSIDVSQIKRIVDFPYFPSSIFKHVQFGETAAVVRTLQSSGTTSQLKSIIRLDSTTSRRQTKVLTKILSALLGKSRRPFLILDVEPKTNTNDHTLSARIAGMSGYLMAAKSRTFVGSETDGAITLNRELMTAVCEKLYAENNPPVIIGYTYMVFHLLLESGINLRGMLPAGTSLLHFGGWKKLKDRRVPKHEFNNRIHDVTGMPLSELFDVYGFTEQLGAVYPSVGNSPAKVPVYSRVIVRDPTTLRPALDGETGLLQFLCPIPNSYPGQSLLNDDLGSGSQSDNGYYNEFYIRGRPDNAIARGCGDTLPKGFYL